MIYTVTINPSLDYIVDVKHFKVGVVNRTDNETMYPGGKGINVAIVLHNLGIPEVALGFTAGFTGEQIYTMLEAQGVTTDFIRVNKGLSRINVKLRSDNESEINGQGPSVTRENLDTLFRKLDRLNDDDILVLAGSIPSTLPESLYMDIMKRLSEKKTRVVVDATRDLLTNVLKYHPFLIKPNNHELGEIFGCEIKSKADVAAYARKLQERGARNVLVSMAGDGAVLLTEDGDVYESGCPKGKLVNSVGAGDSMVAGFLAGYLENKSYTNAFKMGLCTGTASACSEWLATKDQVTELMNTTQFNF